MIAGPVLLVLCAIFRVRMWPSWRELRMLALIGVLMLGFGNTAVMWSELYLSSGLTALLAATIPLYAALIEMFLPNDGELPARGWVGVFIGFCGLVFLVWPGLTRSLHGDWQQMIAAGVALFGAFCWTVASVISRRATIRISGLASAAWQMLFGGIFITIVMFASGNYHGATVGRSGVECDALPGRLRLAGGLLRVHLPAGPCGRVKGGDLCVCQSGDRRRAGSDLPAGALRYGGVCGDGRDPAGGVSGDELEAEDRRGDSGG